MTDITKFNELEDKLKKYNHLRVWTSKEGLNILNLNINKQLVLFKKPMFKSWGYLTDNNTGNIFIVLKPQFNRALDRLYKIAEDINKTQSLKNE